jgi:hypothetical protein
MRNKIYVPAIKMAAVELTAAFVFNYTLLRDGST